MIDRVIFQLPGFRQTLMIMALFSFLRGFAVIGQSLSLAFALSNLWHRQDLSEQVVWLVVFAVCFVLRQLFINLQESILEKYAARCADSLREDVLRQLFSTGQRMVQETGSGNLTTLLIEGIDLIEGYIRLILPKMAAIVIIPVMLLAVIFPLDWATGIIALLVFPAIILQMVLIGSSAQQVAAARHDEFQGLSNHFTDSLRGIDTLKLFGRSKEQGRSIYESSERFRETTMKTLRVATLSSAVLDTFATLSTAACAVLLGFRLVDGSVVLFPALASLVLLPEFFRPIREFAADYHASLDGKNALVSIMKLAGKSAEETSARTEDAELPETIKPAANANMSAEGTIASWNTQSRLTLVGLSFSYLIKDVDAADNDEQVKQDAEIAQAAISEDAPESFALQDVSFEVSGFSKIGIIGPSGGGKSTLMNLLAGFAAPTQGVFQINGQNFAQLERSDWRRQVAYIPQNPYLFHASLRDNLRFYRPDVSDEALWEAIHTVGLDELLSELPDGLETLIGEGARALSGGQAQRIALARALLDSERRIWLFDEPTAHLDIETEQELKERMLPLMENRLVFFATHRLHWIQNMDQIIVMDHGSVQLDADIQERFLKTMRGEEA